jgi:DNA-binding transcriptional MerR regulator
VVTRAIRRREMTDDGMSMRGCRPIVDWEPSGEERDAAERAVAKIRITDEGLPTLDDLDGEELYVLHLWLEELARRRGLVAV